MRALPFDVWDEVVDAGTYEQCFDALNEVVRQLEAGELALDDAVRCYEVGAGLARRCNALLRGAELRVSNLGDLAAESPLPGSPASWDEDDELQDAMR